MSGHLDKSLAHWDWPDEGVELLSKPFRKSELARKIRTVLDGGTAVKDRLSEAATRELERR